MSKILIASQNSYKIDEITPILQAVGFEVTDARMFDLPEPVEDSGTFIGNARIKARAAVEATGMAVIADDSGLIVDALGDFPGVETAPYVKECGGYPEAIADLFKRLDGRPSDCHYVCVLLVRFPEGSEIIANGKVHGRLVPQPRGAGKFGYDPWFEIAGQDKHFAEISAEEKNRISHRGIALQDLLRQLRNKMPYALYLDPCKKSVVPDMPHEAPSIAYWRLMDCDEEQLTAFAPENYAQADFTIAEIHPAQLETLEVPVNRLSIVQQKSQFRDLTLLKTRLQDIQCDITFNWDKRFSVDYYIKILRFWLQCGVQHISIYELVDFEKWQRIQLLLREYNFHFYDRYHACLPGYESPYQKHIAHFGNLFAIGGWSRLTAGNITHVKGPTQKNWELLSDEDRIVEKLLFAFADRDGMEMEALKPYLTDTGLGKAMAAGLVTMNGSRVVPTDTGLWDTVNLVSQLHNN